MQRLGIGARSTLLAVSVLTVGCSTDAVDSIDPSAIFPPAPTAQIVAPTPAASTGNSPGEYPNLNVPPSTATTQMTAEEAEAKKLALKARSDATNAARNLPADKSARLTAISQTHADEALKVIEGN